MADMIRGNSKQVIKREKSTRDNQNIFYLHPDLFQAFRIDPHLGLVLLLHFFFFLLVRNSNGFVIHQEPPLILLDLTHDPTDPFSISCISTGRYS